jgi:dienelactone hydrolase
VFVALCPAPSPLLASGLRSGRLAVAAEAATLQRLLAANPLEAAVAALEQPVLIQHAEGDEQVPASGSRALAARFRHPDSRLQVTPAGDHRSVQHDPAAQAAALAWLREVIGWTSARRTRPSRNRAERSRPRAAGPARARSAPRPARRRCCACARARSRRSR